MSRSADLSISQAFPSQMVVVVVVVLLLVPREGASRSQSVSQAGSLSGNQSVSQAVAQPSSSPSDGGAGADVVATGGGCQHRRPVKE